MSASSFGPGNSRQAVFHPGTAARPGLTPLGDIDSGLYWIAANNLGVSVAGAKVLDISAAGLGITGQLLAANGSLSAPSISFTNEANSGFYTNGVDAFAAVCGGAKTVDFTTAGLAVTGALSCTGNATLGDASGDSVTINAGTVSIPNGINFSGGGNIGIDRTPSAWGAAYRAIQAEGASLWGGTSALTGFFSCNTYLDGTNYRAIETGAGSQIVQAGGIISFERFASVAAGAVQTQVESARIDASGNLLVGTTNTSESIGEGFKFLPQSGVPRFAIAGGASGATTAFSIYSTAASAYRFYVDYDGKIYATNTSITGISDATLKKNIRDLDTGIAEILALRPRLFDLIDGASDLPGFVSQEVLPVLPALVAPFQYGPDGETKLGLRTGDMMPTVVRSVQQLVAALETYHPDIRERLAA